MRPPAEDGAVLGAPRLEEGHQLELTVQVDLNPAEVFVAPELVDGRLTVERRRLRGALVTSTIQVSAILAPLEFVNHLAPLPKQLPPYPPGSSAVRGYLYGPTRRVAHRSVLGRS